MRKRSITILISTVWFLLIVISAFKEEKVKEKISESGFFSKVEFFGLSSEPK